MSGRTPSDGDLLEKLRRRSAALGLRGPAITRATPPPGAGAALMQWLGRGLHGEMHYMARLGQDRADPSRWASWARSVALVADSYAHNPACPEDPSAGAISRYARGRDYHDVLRAKLETLAQVLTSGGRRHLVFVDSSPLMEKALAASGGLGWIGKNGNLLQLQHGSFFFLGGLVTDAVWPADPPSEDLCGTCDLCLDSCPTQAIVSPGVIDARRCIAYLTIELKGPIPRHLRPAMGNRIFGCDDCQDVCPLNRPAPGGDPAYLHGTEPLDLLSLARLDEPAFRQRFRHTPVWRSRWRGFLRNVMVALGNWGEPQAVEALREGLQHPEPLVRQHAAWGLGRAGGQVARDALHLRAGCETDAATREEIRHALEESASA